MRPRILYITHRVPWPPDRGDRIRTWNVLKYLSAQADVDLACLADEPVSEATMTELQRVTSRLAVITHGGKKRYASGLLSLASGNTVTEGLFHCRSLTRTLRDWDRTSLYTASLASSSGVARYLFRPFFSQTATRWVDLTDVDSQKWLDYSRASSFPLSMVYATEGRRLRKVEQTLAARCERLLVVSEAERDLFRSFCPTDRIRAVSNGVDSAYFAPGRTSNVDPHSCVFVGVMNYKPNADAAIWFADHVFPRLQQLYPDAAFRIVGKSPTADVRSLAMRPGIEVTGSVPDVRPWLYRSTCAVVPLHIARGVQNKVLEAMSCGRPVICSSSPLKGLAAEPGLHLLKADTAEEWVQSICRVFTDTCLQDELGMAGAAYVQLKHSWNHCLAPLDDLLVPTTHPCPELSESVT
ncbi:MAG: TIGR03087 family PEP-CTERM/XrtA system glycosyltransferase [Planctomycetota bacterium]